jgi:hypothetical protein
MISTCLRRATMLLLVGASLLPVFNSQPSARAAATTIAPERSAAALGPLINIPQTWNNCGPTSVAEVLAYWGITRDQYQVKAVLRGDGNPYGMAPYDVPAYMRSLGMRALIGIAGSEKLVKSLVSNGFPVIVSQFVSVTDHVGHYRPIQAYDDAQRIFVSSDPYLGQNHPITYDDFDTIWQSTNRRFIVLYPPTRQELLNQVLAAAGWQQAAAYSQDLLRLANQIKHKRASGTGYGSPRNNELAVAWDNLELGRYSASRQLLAQALKASANPIVVGWIASEISYASAGRA